MNLTDLKMFERRKASKLLWLSNKTTCTDSCWAKPKKKELVCACTITYSISAGLLALQQNKDTPTASQATTQTEETERARNYEKELQDRDRIENQLQNQIQQLEDTIRRLNMEIVRKDTQLDLQREREGKMHASLVCADVISTIKCDQEPSKAENASLIERNNKLLQNLLSVQEHLAKANSDRLVAEQGNEWKLLQLILFRCQESAHLAWGIRKTTRSS